MLLGLARGGELGMKGEGEKEGFKGKLQQGFAVVVHVFLSWLAGVGFPCKGEWPFERGGRGPFIVFWWD